MSLSAWKSSPRILAIAVPIAILGLITAVYWPVHAAGFVWIDKIIFHDNAWLRYGDAWKQFIFHNFYEWINYFRPLVVALFVAEVRLFDTVPGPMHLVSLAIHIANTLLVGALVLQLGKAQPHVSRWLAGLSMLLFGLHPALVEPVVWISCQFELVVTFFILLALFLNQAIEHTGMRAAAVAACFFLAACAKESAASLPILLVIFDCVHGQRHAERGWPAIARAIWQRQRAIYASVFFAGILYLSARYAALGFVVQSNGKIDFFSLRHFQEVCFTYLAYWRILVWPMQGLGPIHLVNAQRFAAFGIESILIDAAAMSILAIGLILAARRKPLGGLILSVSVALLPVLHIVPIAFDQSLYHERYALTAIALACALLPCVILDTRFASAPLKMTAAFFVVPALWLILAILNIRVTLPLWSDEAKLWLWALQENPGSIMAEGQLLTTYIDAEDLPHANQIADRLLAQKAPCPQCMVNIAYLALAAGDVQRATQALDLAKSTARMLQPSTGFREGFILATGQLRELQGDLSAAEEAYRDAITTEPFDPQPQMNLAVLLARQGKSSEARQIFEKALPLLAPDQLVWRRQQFEKALSTPLLPLPKG